MKSVISKKCLTEEEEEEEEEERRTKQSLDSPQTIEANKNSFILLYIIIILSMFCISGSRSKP